MQAECVCVCVCVCVVRMRVRGSRTDSSASLIDSSLLRGISYFSCLEGSVTWPSAPHGLQVRL